MWLSKRRRMEKAADRGLVQRPDAEGVQGGTGEIIPESMIFMKVVKNI